MGKPSSKCFFARKPGFTQCCRSGMPCVNHLAWLPGKPAKEMTGTNMIGDIKSVRFPSIS